jgi:hypothetical protein
MPNTPTGKSFLALFFKKELACFHDLVRIAARTQNIYER